MVEYSPHPYKEEMIRSAQLHSPSIDGIVRSLSRGCSLGWSSHTIRSRATTHEGDVASVLDQKELDETWTCLDLFLIPICSRIVTPGPTPATPGCAGGELVPRLRSDISWAHLPRQPLQHVPHGSEPLDLRTDRLQRTSAQDVDGPARCPMAVSQHCGWCCGWSAARGVSRDGRA